MTRRRIGARFFLLLCPLLAAGGCVPLDDRPPRYIARAAAETPR